MKRIILFRFHGYSEAYTSRLKSLIKLNPHIPIYGLYGGNKRAYNKIKKNFNQYFRNIYRIPVSNWRWRWKNGDLSINLWYKELGNKIDFDMVYIIEWDLLLFESVPKVYNHINKNSVGLTGLKILGEVEDKWDWTSEEPSKTEWKKLLQYVKKKFDYSKENYGCLGFGYCLPKKFIEKYSK